jgi:tRNA 2-thiocytidine biosynthesis protein TtcA
VALGNDAPLMKVTTADATTAATTSTLLDHHEDVEKLQGKLLKQIRETCLDYQMLEEGDHIMVCVSGGKDSAVMLYLLRMLQEKLPVNFQLTAAHVDQHQPGYDGRPLVTWLDELHVPFDVVSEDTYSIVMEKTPENKSFCTVCSRLRRGILYSKAMELGCNKIALGHHADDAMETLLLNMLHAGQMKAMPARYTSKRGSLAVLRPLIKSMEADIERYAMMKGFPILPCNLCSNQANLQRPQVKLLLNTLGGMNPNAKQNLLRAMSDIRPSHLLDQNLREACGMDPITGDDDHDDDAELR